MRWKVTKDMGQWIGSKDSFFALELILGGQVNCAIRLVWSFLAVLQ